MGWFLSSKTKGRKGKGKSKSRGKTRAGSPLQGKGWDPARTLANMWLMSWMLILLGGAAAWYFGEGYLIDYVSDQHRHKPVTVELVDTPAWMPERLTRDLRQQVELMVDADPFDRESLARAAQVLDTKPWIEHVDRVVRTGPASIEVHASYRRPTALVRAEDGYHLVDGQGIRLPGRYPADQVAATGLPVIRGVEQGPPQAGRRWPGLDVEAGLLFVRLLRTVDWAEDVAAVDVHNYAGRVDHASPHIVIPTRYGGVLRWGRAIGEEQFHEPAAKVKLRHVQRVRRQARTICANGRIVDVFHDTINIHQARADDGNSSGADSAARRGAGLPARHALHSHE